MPDTAFVAAHVCLVGGLVCETSENNGIFPFMSRCLMRGTRSSSADRIAEAFAARGSSLRVSAGLNQFGCSFVSLPDDTADLMRLMAEVLCTPAFDAGELDKVRAQQMDAIARQDEDWYRELIHFARSVFYEKSPFRMARLGTCENLERFTSADLLATHTRFVTGSNAVITVAGCVDCAVVRGLVEDHFGGLRASGEDPLHEVEPEPGSPGDRFFIKKATSDREVAGIFLGFPGLSFADRADRCGVTLVETMLAGYALSGGRLYTALRGGHRDMVYEVSNVSLIGLSPGYVAFAAACEPGRVNDVYQTMRSEINALRDGEFSEAELDRARGMVITGELDQLQTPADLAARVSADVAFGSGAEDWEAFLEEIRGVSHRQVVDTAGDYLRRATIAVVTPEPLSVDLGLDPE